EPNSMNFIDAHMHFWDRGLMPYTWLHEVPSIWERHTFENLRAEAGGELPEKVVFVEAGAPGLAEVKWVEELARTEPRICGIVAKIFINEGAETTAAIAEFKKHPLVRGVRHHFEHDALDYCRRPEFIAGVRELSAAGLSFDICCKHPQLPAVIELVRSCPEVQFILDHGGKPGIRAGLMDPWREHIRTLSAMPNIVCKLSGLVTEANHQAWTVEQIRPYAEHLLETFGPTRLLFGGDWPVAKLACGYVKWLEVARGFVAKLSAEEQRAIFSGNAERVYRV
ncbi:MAG TPA: amidohydrolase family protein, partial [Verrucomicrobiae bacterium]|nr:amidohydrolase family protein [Verrucomicrobiae bacterium]